MASIWTEQDLGRALGAEPVHSRPELRAHGISIDSRTCRVGNLFVCLRGERTDGHQYIKGALAAGANAIIIEESYLAAGALDLPPAGSMSVFAVPDGLVALQDLARFHRHRLPSELCLIAISGSNGKTSTKEILSSLLRNLLVPEQVFATAGNLNNHIGVPLSLLEIDMSCEYAIIEMGMNHSGEISFLSHLARPHHALVSSISGAHMQFFDSLEQIARAKFEIHDGLEKNASQSPLLLWPRHAPLQKEFQKIAQSQGIQLVLFDTVDDLGRSNQFRITREGMELKWQDHLVHNPNLFSPVMAANLQASLFLLQSLGFDPATLVRSAGQVALQSKGRFEVHRLPRKSASQPQLLVDDSYNANPDSFIRALEALRQLLLEGRLALVSGEMAELGDDAAEQHRLIGDRAAQLGYECVWACGTNLASQMIAGFEKEQTLHQKSRLEKDSHSLISNMDQELLAALEQYDGILVKGSRSARMERVVEALLDKQYV